MTTSDGRKWRCSKAGGHNLRNVSVVRSSRVANVWCVEVITRGNAITGDVQFHRRESPND
ncbi:hypothetical protein RMSM_01517 [Rhodopirellula maiorica SM1]|uniref:Uncharacterized protein n=1 Tax=Rhodopirellula maiorica SM1 TaxID=1265738 RepID=M5S1L7_9BACT|nr:hypothetical protein RMSM_01517 [Rhodopirellula maiorica SM1]